MDREDVVRIYNGILLHLEFKVRIRCFCACVCVCVYVCVGGGIKGKHTFTHNGTIKYCLKFSVFCNRIIDLNLHC